MKQNKKFRPVGDVYYRPDGIKVTVVNIDGPGNYRERMDKVLEEMRLDANAQPDMATPEDAA